MANELKLSLVELKAEHRALVTERNKEDRIARRDPTFTAEQKQSILDESKRLISDSKKTLDDARDEVRAEIVRLKGVRNEIIAEYDKKVEEAKAKTYEGTTPEEISAKTADFDERYKLFNDNYASVCGELNDTFTTYKLEKLSNIKELKAEFKTVRADKTIPLKEKDAKLEDIKNKIFQLEHGIDRKKAKIDSLLDEEKEKHLKENKEFMSEKKWIGKPLEAEIAAINTERKAKIAEINALIDENRENLKFYNTFGYKALINTKDKFIEFGRNTKANFTHLDLFKEWLIKNILFIIVIIFVIIVAISTGGSFLSWKSIVNIITQTSFRLPIALGIAGIIVLTGTDLSAGRIVGLTGIISLIFLGGANAKGTIVFPWTTNMPGIWLLAVLILAMVIGGLFGAFNGFFVAKFQIHPFIVTLSTQLIIYGLAQLITSPELLNASTTSLAFTGIAGQYREVISGGFNLFGAKVSWYVIYAILLVALVWFIWNKTKMGKNMFAVGCNQEAATVSGISVFKTILITFIFAGVLYAISGFEVNPILGGASVDTGTNFELDAITAAVIGGVSFTGGIGKVSGVVIGAIFLQLITAGLQSMSVPASYIYIIKGAVIILATALDMKKYIAKK